MRIEGISLPNQNINQHVNTLQGENAAENFSNALKQAVEKKDDKELIEACQEIETYMISSIFKQMKKSTEMGESLIPKGDYEEMFESNMVDEMAKNMTKAGGIGLAKSLYEQLSKN